MIRYRIEPDDLHTHHWRVTLGVAQPAAETILSLPVWIAGSYMVREFGRHVSGLQARQGARPLAVEALDKTTWRVRCSGRATLVLSYRVYAFDASVRGAFLDAHRGFFNNTALCLRVQGREAQPHRLTLGALPAGWQVATAMAAAPGGGARAFEAGSYDELLDHPFELGSFWRGRFDAGGVPHELVVTGALPGFDGERLLADTRRICEQQIAFWHAPDRSRPPFSRYIFLLHAVEEGFGGLEHRASTALAAARRDLPRAGMDGLPDGYVALLGLISHEYFHTWNVKRLKPAELAEPDHRNENHTRLLWFFEGFTSYYDELMLRRCGLIDRPRYLRLLAKTVNAVAATPGRRVQSVAEASFDAWVKYYRSDENTPNATVSYYQKGALVALALDLTLRRRGASLDELMRSLWRRSGAAGDVASGGAVTEADIAAMLAEVAGQPLDAVLRDWVHGTGELPLAELLPDFGVQWRAERAGFAASLGLRLSEGPVSGVQVKSVLVGSAAAAAGLSAGDELLAIDGWRIRRLDDALAWVAPAQPFELLLVRDQRVLTLTLRPDARSPLASTVSLQLQDKPLRGAAARRRAWIGD
ncbi:MAG: M61 family metallopeptidase [Burkholderiaceae bacterium]|nr:M61 family metallopeptidase [Burkholderiaceae bacterium]